MSVRIESMFYIQAIVTSFIVAMCQKLSPWRRVPITVPSAGHIWGSEIYFWDDLLSKLTLSQTVIPRNPLWVWWICTRIHTRGCSFYLFPTGRASEYLLHGGWYASCSHPSQGTPGKDLGPLGWERTWCWGNHRLLTDRQLSKYYLPPSSGGISVAQRLSTKNCTWSWLPLALMGCTRGGKGPI